MTGAAFCGLAGLLLLFGLPLGSFVRFGWPVVDRLLWDGALSLLFFVQHSGMLRRSVQARLRVPDYCWAALYAVASGTTLIVVCILWQSTGDAVLVFDAPGRIAAYGATALAGLLFVWGVVSLGGCDLLGLRAIRAHLKGARPKQPRFMVRGPYRWVRHPLYFAVLVVIWVRPDPTLDRALFDLLWTAWIVVGTRFEEADLLADFGDDYARYRRAVPCLIPWRGPSRI